MKDIFKIGDQKIHEYVVIEEDSASFNNVQVHPVLSTFSLGREAEWVCRLFVLDMKEELEEGIGSFLDIKHISPALIGQTVKFIAEVESIKGTEIICSYEAFVGDRIVAKGRQGQHILATEKIQTIFKQLEG